MRKFLIVLMGIVLFVGCGKVDHSHDLLNSVCDEIRGKYVCKSFQWSGEPAEIDVDGDGVAHDNLLYEFSNMPNCAMAVNAPCFIYPALEYDETVFFYFELPMQDITWDKLAEKFCASGGYGNTQYVDFGYAVDKNGNVSFSTHNERNESKSNETISDIEHYDSQFITGDRILSFRNGVMELCINYGFYDFSSGKFVKGQAKLVYERKSYSL